MVTPHLEDAIMELEKSARNYRYWEAQYEIEAGQIAHTLAVKEAARDKQRDLALGYERAACLLRAEAS